MLRADLFYRLAALRITVPPLRQRGEDILILFTRLSEQFAEEYGCDAPQVSAQEAAQLLVARGADPSLRRDGFSALYVPSPIPSLTILGALSQRPSGDG